MCGAMTCSSLTFALDKHTVTAFEADINVQTYDVQVSLHSR